jgi:hypothetical protein
MLTKLFTAKTGKGIPSVFTRAWDRFRLSVNREPEATLNTFFTSIGKFVFGR